MPRRTPMPPGVAFGERMAALRKQIGMTQRDLAAEIGISQRMVAYYEIQTEYPPAHLLPALSEVFGMTTDALLGIEKAVPRGPSVRRFLSRFERIQDLPPKARKQLLFIIDAFLERYEDDDDEDER